MKAQHLVIDKLSLEAGGSLERATVHYRTRGTLDGSKPLAWVFHALTANDNPEEWWSGLFLGDGAFSDWDIVCVNVIGSPYGSASPKSHGGMHFPSVTVRDTVRAQLYVAEHLAIARIDALVGGSFGGYQALEFASQFTGELQAMILLATGAEEKPWNKAIHEAMRLALRADVTLISGGGEAGLKAARGIGMLKYRTADQFNQSQSDDPEQLTDFRACSYINYNGQKLVERFDAACYYALLNQLDTHQLGRARGGLSAALHQIKTPTLVIGVDSDVLIPVAVQEELVQGLPHATLQVIQSAYGHDGFLIEYQQINEAISQFFNA